MNLPVGRVAVRPWGRTDGGAGKTVRHRTRERSPAIVTSLLRARQYPGNKGLAVGAESAASTDFAEALIDQNAIRM
jgi:hypothetical protein